MRGRPIRLYWCENMSHTDKAYSLEFVQPEEHRTGHYHVSDLEGALKWYDYEVRVERVEVLRVTTEFDA